MMMKNTLGMSLIKSKLKIDVAGIYIIFFEKYDENYYETSSMKLGQL